MKPPDTPGASAITRGEVADVAALAMLSLTDEELDVFTGQLAAVLEHARDVEALDVHDVAPTHHPYPLVNILRPDVVAVGADPDEVLAVAPDVEDHQFKVPPALGEEP